MKDEVSEAKKSATGLAEEQCCDDEKSTSWFEGTSQNEYSATQQQHASLQDFSNLHLKPRLTRPTRSPYNPRNKSAIEQSMSVPSYNQRKGARARCVSFLDWMECDDGDPDSI